MSDAHDDDEPAIGSRASRPADDAPTPPVSELEAIRAELEAEAEKPTPEKLVRLQVPERPGWVVVCTTVGVTYNRVLAWRKRDVVKKKGAPGGVSELMSGALVISEQCRSIVRNGSELVHEGEPVTFRDPVYRQILGGDDAVESVLKTFKNDWHVIAAGNQLLAEAGFGHLVGMGDDDDGDDELDSPTTR